MDVTNSQAQVQLASVKNQMLNQFEYLPNSNGSDFKLIRSDCKVKWTDGKEFIYHNNTIHSRPSFLSPLSKLLQYAYVDQHNDDNVNVILRNLFLQTIHRLFTQHLKTSSPSQELAQADLKDFFLYFLNHADENVRQTGTKLVTTFVNDLSASADVDLPPLISCSTMKHLFESMIENEHFQIDEIILNGCLRSSLNWSIDDLCSLLTSLSIHTTRFCRIIERMSSICFR
ncbi:unnamed protein product [Didymodactylos carnosus]|uniref:Uncharacterized protein n=1 Tax=Didymodactylos carnosus TaxID=1234261 RepID=A0A815FDD9_9BILA|nr:unnamed protein product [Didymodactylos carnosus]CAF4171841.1 unnamed protein product [Didymodactylos carnosus]